VNAPILVPLTIIVAAIRGFPKVSDTVPVTVVVCAVLWLANNAIRAKIRRFRIMKLAFVVYEYKKNL
jgi:hypothetical protein